MAATVTSASEPAIANRRMAPPVQPPNDRVRERMRAAAIAIVLMSAGLVFGLLLMARDVGRNVGHTPLSPSASASPSAISTPEPSLPTASAAPPADPVAPTEEPSKSSPSPTDAAEALAGAWTAQVASRGPNDSDNEFNDKWKKLKARYPDAVKFWSGDWPGTYGPSHRRSWVIVSGVRHATTEPLLEWCEDQELEACWAVRLAKSGDPERNIDRPPADERNN